MSTAIEERPELIRAQKRLNSLKDELSRLIVGQDALLRRLTMALVSDGHVLVEGVPGLAKTTAIKALSAALDMSFRRVQFTPDLLPADILGTSIYNPKTGEFSIKKGPLFTHILLADEINRAPAKVQSALLEAMQEGQVTIAEQSLALNTPFLVMATQNPIEQEGTYPLPEAQLDRFMFKVLVEYPSAEEEKTILDRCAGSSAVEINRVLGPGDVIEIRDLADSIYVDDRVKDYVVSLVQATRRPAELSPDFERVVSFGASPRGSLFLVRAARVNAMMQGRAYVTPQDVKQVGPDVLRHRIILSYEAEAEGLKSDDVIQRIFETVEVP